MKNNKVLKIKIEGEKPIKGKDYFTKQDQKEIVKDILSLIPESEKVDYKKIRSFVKEQVSKIKIPEPIPGKDAIVDYDNIVSNVLKKIPEPDIEPLKEYIDESIKKLDLESVFGRRLLNSGGPTTRLGEISDIDVEGATVGQVLKLGSDGIWRPGNDNDAQDLQSVTDNGSTTTNSITANSFITSGGTSSQFVKGDGTLDSNTYLTAEADTLQTVTDRGSTTTNTVTISPTGNNDGLIANGSGSGSGIDITHNGSGDSLKITHSGAGAQINGNGFDVDNDGDTVAKSFSGDGAGLTNLDSNEVIMDEIGTATYRTVQQMQDIFHSTGLGSGGTINDVGGNNITTDALTGYIRATNDPTDTLLVFDCDGLTSTAIPADSVRYIGVEYNAGSPQVVVRTTYNWNFNTDFPLGNVVNSGGTLHVENTPHQVGDHAGLMIQRLYGTMPYRRDERVGGVLLGETGTRNITLTAGIIWEKLNSFTINAKDTSVSDTFETWYYNGSTWVRTGSVTQWNNTQYNNVATGLATMTNNWYANIYFYLELDGGLHAVYGQNQYATAGDAEDEAPPSLVPPKVTAHSFLIGRILFRKSASTATAIESVYGTTFSTTSATTHNNLAGLQGGTIDEYYHLTAAEKTVVENTSGTNTGDQDLSHTGEVTGTTQALTLDKTAISNRTDTVITASDTILFGDATDSNNLKKDTVQGILDLAPATTPAGSDTQLQFNDGGSFGATPDMIWNDTLKGIVLGTSNGDSGVYLDGGDSGMERVFDALDIKNDDGDIYLKPKALTGNIQFNGATLLNFGKFSVSPGAEMVFEVTDSATFLTADIRLAYSFFGSGFSLYAPDTLTGNNLKIGTTTYPIEAIYIGDNNKMIYGDGQDATIYYNGTDLIIDPKEVGTGKLDVRGDVEVDSLTSTAGRIKNTTRVTTTYTILTTDDVVFANTDSAGYTVTLPAGVEGQTFKIINSGSSGNILTVAPNGAEHLLGANSSFTLNDGETLLITYNATDGWY